MISAGKKIRSLVLIIAFLFVTNIVLLFFLLFSKNGDEGSRSRDTRSVVESFLQDSIGFDKKQMDVYHHLRKADFEKRRPLIEHMKAARNNFYQHIYSDTVPDSAINKSALEYGEAQTTIDQHMLRYFKNVRRICTTGQLQKFDSTFKSVVEKVNPGRFQRRSNH